MTEGKMFELVFVNAPDRPSILVAEIVEGIAVGYERYERRNGKSLRWFRGEPNAESHIIQLRYVVVDLDRRDSEKVKVFCYRRRELKVVPRLEIGVVSGNLAAGTDVGRKKNQCK